MHEQLIDALSHVFGKPNTHSRFSIHDLSCTLVPLLHAEIDFSGGITINHVSYIARPYCSVSETRIAQYFTAQAAKYGFHIDTVDTLVRSAFRLSKDTEIEMHKETRRGPRLGSNVLYHGDEVIDYIRAQYTADSPVALVRIRETMPFT